MGDGAGGDENVSRGKTPPWEQIKLFIASPKQQKK